MNSRRKLVLLLLGGLCAPVLFGQAAKELPGSSECAGCHDTGRRTGKREAGNPPPFDAAALRASPHAEVECSSCHADTDPKKLPHADKLAPVDCGSCHTDQQEQFAASLHGRAIKRGDKLAPSCKDCHGRHTVKRASTPGSPTSTMGVPRLCGPATAKERRSARRARSIRTTSSTTTSTASTARAVQARLDRRPRSAQAATPRTSSCRTPTRDPRSQSRTSPKPAPNAMPRSRGPPQSDPRRVVGEAVPPDSGLRRLPRRTRSAGSSTRRVCRTATAMKCH